MVLTQHLTVYSDRGEQAEDGQNTLQEIIAHGRPGNHYINVSLCGKFNACALQTQCSRHLFMFCNAMSTTQG